VKLRRLELIVDVIWVLLSVWYVLTASTYPSAGRLIPMSVGIAVFLIGSFQLIGYFVPALRVFTHGRPPARGDADAPAAEEVASLARAERREWIAILWALLLLAGIYVLGYLITVPLFFLAYFLFQRPMRWKLALISAVVMGGLTYLVFYQLLSVQLYPGLLFGG
jgi:hypothetical protein